jgi:class 3 adenylate cyclase
MSEDELKRKLATIMVADVVAYSRLTAQDEDWTIRALGDFRKVVDGIIARHDGRIFNTGGDSVLAEFASPVEAVRCAVDFQEAARSRNLLQPPEHQLRYRIGINLGDVMVRGDDLLGDGVNVAARLEGIAEPDGICVSSTVWDQINGKLSIGYVDIGEQSVKNIPRPVRAYHLRVDGGSTHVPTASVATSVSVPQAAATGLGATAPKGRNYTVAALAVTLVAVIAGSGLAVWKPWSPSSREVLNTAQSPASPPVAAASPSGTTGAAAAPISVLQALPNRLKIVAPAMSDDMREAAVREYFNGGAHKAQVVSVEPPGFWTHWNASSSVKAVQLALESCQVYFGRPCVLIIADDALPPLPADGKPLAQDMPRVSYAGKFDPAQIPGSDQGLRERDDVVHYSGHVAPKAASYHPMRTRLFIVTSAAEQHVAEVEALKACNDDTATRKLRGPCFLYAVGDRVVLPLRLREPLTPAPK